ncbi:MAG: hypothetical protein LBE34_01960 [Flavobacteriaceae bacterium]|jgi:antitoxin component YwqK of YwqJK toxin-antitoxin module/Tfp pilus assembly protein PilF|nr:hypothetical protein [Flavobacteriaceae bacterium]
MKKLYFPLLFLTIALNTYAQDKTNLVYDTNALELQAHQYVGNNEIEQAIAEYRKIDESDPNYLEAQQEIILLLIELKKTAEAEELCKKLIDQYGDDLPSNCFLSYGILKSDQQKYDEALHYLGKAKNKNSLNIIVKYNEALVYFRQEEKQKGLDLLKEIITLAPNYPKAYYMLGLIAIEDGKGSIGLLSLLTYLSLNPDTAAAQQCLNQLNRNLAEVYSITPKLIYSNEGDDFSELDIILKNNLAQHKNYPLKIDIDHRVSRVIQALLEYANDHQVKNGFFENRLTPWMKEVVQQNLIVPFTYVSMRLTKDAYKKQYKKNAAIITNYLTNSLYTQIYPKLYKATIDGQLFHISNLDTGYLYYQGEEDNLNGLAIEFSTNYYKKSEGYFTANKLDGILKHYNSNGTLTTISNYKDDEINGVVSTYYSTGKVYMEEHMKGELYDGATSIYYPATNKKASLTYKENKPTGEINYFFPTGQEEYKYQLIDGKKEGEIIIYNEKGTIVHKNTYKADLLDGLSTAYYLNGNIKSESLFKEDQYIYYKEFYENGQISNYSQYENGQLKDNKSYDFNGKLTDHRTFNTQGDLVSSVLYDSEQIYFSEKYKGKKIIERQSINPKTLKLEVTTLKDYGSFYYPNGILYAEGKTINGLYEGVWKYYYSHGPLLSEINYVAGIPNGQIKKYNCIGELEEDFFVTDNVMTGLYSYYASGQLNYTAYYKEGELHGPTNYYYDYPIIKNKQFYTNGVKSGKDIYYLQNGTPYRIDNYENESMARIDFINDHKTEYLHLDQFNEKSLFTLNQFNSKTIYTLEKGTFTGSVKRFDSTGKIILSSYHLINNKLDGEYLNYYINGTLNERYTLILDKMYGAYENYNPDGKLRVRLNALGGNRSGSRVLYFPDGKKVSDTNFVLNYQDGEETFYNSQGTPVLVLIYKTNVPIGYKTLTDSERLSTIFSITSKDTLITSKYKSGQLAAQVSLKKQALDGELLIYNTDGKSAYSQTFFMSKKDGVEKIYYPNGQVYSTTTFKKDNLTGTNTIYTPTGLKQFELNYNQGELHGAFHIFENNTIKQTFNYDSDYLSK